MSGAPGGPVPDAQVAAAAGARLSLDDRPSAASEAAPVAEGGWAAFRHRDFRLFSAARFLSGIALQTQNVAMGWFVYELTGSALALGLVGLAAFLPAVACALVTGHVADTYDRRLVGGLAFATMGAAAGGLLVYAQATGPAHTLPIWPVYALVVITGTARAFGNPATQALLPTLVPREVFGSAIAWNSSIWQTASITGPAVGGFLYVLGPTVVFAVAACAFALASALLFAVRYRAAATKREPVSWTSLVAGLAYIRSQPVIFGAISLDLVAVLLGGATALLPIFAQDVLGTGPWGLGLLRSAPAVGGVLTAVALANRPLRRRVGRRMLVAVAVFGLGTIGFGLSRSLPLSMLCLFCLGCADMISVFVRQTLVQGETPDAMRGRVAAVNTVFIGASNELGEFESGALAALVGAVPAVVLGGAATVLVALAWARLFPALRDRDRLVA